MPECSGALTFRDFSYGFRERNWLVHGLNLSLGFGESLFLRGDNGTGKSTLLRILADQLTLPTQGAVEASVPVTESVLVPQVVHGDFHLPVTLRDVISMGNPDRRCDTFGLLTEEDLSLAWQSASGGERQKTVFARSLNQRPRMILIDEPTNHLDRESVAIYWRVLEQYLADEPRRRAAVVACHGERPRWNSVPIREVNLNDYRRGEHSHGS